MNNLQELTNIYQISNDTTNVSQGLMRYSFSFIMKFSIKKFKKFFTMRDVRNVKSLQWRFEEVSLNSYNVTRRRGEKREKTRRDYSDRDYSARLTFDGG